MEEKKNEEVEVGVEEKVEETPKKKRKKWPYFLAGGILAAIILFFVIYNQVNKVVEKVDEKPLYETYEVKEVEPILFKGTVAPKESQTFYADQTLGKLKTIAVKDQQNVKKGDVLFTYENEELKNQISQQDNELQKANLNLGNIQDKIASEKEKLNQMYNKYNQAEGKVNSIPADKEHVEEKTAAKEQLEGMKTEISVQESAIKDLEQSLASAQLDFNQLNKTYDDSKTKTVTTITAPFAGMVHLNEAGKNNPQTPLLNLLSPEVIIKGETTEYDYAYVKPKAPVTVIPVVSKEKIEGAIETVSQLSNDTQAAAPQDMAGGGGGSTTAKYDFTASVKKPIQYGFNVEIQLPLKDLRVPKSAVLEEDDDKHYVFQVVDGKAKKVEVTVTESQGYFKISKGLKLKDVVVKNPDDELKEGMEIKQ